MPHAIKILHNGTLFKDASGLQVIIAHQMIDYWISKMCHYVCDLNTVPVT